MAGDRFFSCGLGDWIAMAMISGLGAIVALLLLALLLLVGMQIAVRLRSLWPDVM